jgi:hypothetical protein
VSIWDDITDPDRWRDAPGRTAAQAAACVVTGGTLCIAGEMSERAGETAAELRSTAEDLREGVAGEGGLVERLSNAAEQPLLRLENILMWGAIGLIAIAAMVVIGAVVYFTWPIVWPLIVGR